MSSWDTQAFLFENGMMICEIPEIWVAIISKIVIIIYSPELLPFHTFFSGSHANGLFATLGCFLLLR